MNYTAYQFELNIKLHGWFFLDEPWCKFIFNHVFTQDKDKGIQIKQGVHSVQVSRFLENRLVNWANQAQCGLLSNLKVGLEKK